MKEGGEREQSLRGAWMVSRGCPPSAAAATVPRAKQERLAHAWPWPTALRGQKRPRGEPGRHRAPTLRYCPPLQDAQRPDVSCVGTRAETPTAPRRDWKCLVNEARFVPGRGTPLLSVTVVGSPCCVRGRLLRTGRDSGRERRRHAAHCPRPSPAPHPVTAPA